MAAIVGILLALPYPARAQRPTSDFEIATAEKNLAAADTYQDRVAAHLNLGDLRAERMEMDAAREHYRAAGAAARTAAADARRRSDLEGYALATAYRGVALAKLGSADEAFGALEESLRYEADSAAVWNHYASAMSVLDLPAKAAAAARNAVLLQEEKSALARTPEALLDLAIYRYALAAALIRGDRRSAEAASILSSITELLDSGRLEPIRRQIAREEGFEVFSFVRDDAAAWLSLYNRTLLRLGGLREAQGDEAGARAAFQRVLERRSDDPMALAALARLAGATAERERLFAESFAANPFSPQTILDYEAYAAGGAPEPEERNGAASMQRAVWLIARGRAGEARPIVERLASGNPANAAVEYLEARIALAAADLPRADALALPQPFRSAIERERAAKSAQRAAAERMLPALAGRAPIDAGRALLSELLPLLADRESAAVLRPRLDEASFASLAQMDPPASSADGVTVFNSGSIDGIVFRFSVPTAFRGVFAGERLRIHYRITGADGATLLIEPLGIGRP
ncbi:MAG TPA: hypothetical protein VGF40_03615 [Thermoanaerobaculia bacterium]